MRSTRRSCGEGEVETAELRGGFVVIQPPAHRVFNRLGLLEDLLEHVVLEVTFVDVSHLMIERADGRRELTGVAVMQIDARLRDDGNLVIGHVHDLIGVTDKRTGIAGDEVLAFADPDHQRTAGPRDHQHVGVLPKQDREAIGALEPAECRLHSPQTGIDFRGITAALSQLVELLRQHVGDRLGVGLRAEDVSLRLQLAAERIVILDDAVVSEHNFALSPLVRMGVGIGRASVCRPAGVTDAQCAMDWLRFDERGEIAHASGPFADVEVFLIMDGDARAVVPAVFEAVQPLEQKGGRVTITDIADNAAHSEAPGSSFSPDCAMGDPIRTTRSGPCLVGGGRNDWGFPARSSATAVGAGRESIKAI